MAFALSDLTAINTAIASGALKVQYADRLVQYQTTSDMLKAKQSIEADLRAQGLLPTQTNTLARTAYAVFERD